MIIKLIGPLFSSGTAWPVLIMIIMGAPCLTFGRSVSSMTVTMVQQQVTGRVISTKGPVVGATVSVQGGLVSTSTDEQGNFTLAAVAGDVLVFTAVGFESQTQVVDGNKIQVSLKASDQALEEVVVVGYGTQRKSDITGSIASVRTQDIEKMPSFRADQALQGRVAGLNVQSTDAAPNANVSIRIRGANSIGGGNDPLVVIDGLQGASLNTLNPNDIASMEVLKDASATAIYGSRGANGVIIVTTKKGNSGKPQFTYNAYGSLNQLRKKLDLLNATQYATLINENRIEHDLPVQFTPEEILSFGNTGTDWQDAIFRNAFQHNQQLSVSGANDHVNYYISGNYLSNEGIMRNSSYQRYAVRSNVDLRLSDKTRLNLNAYLTDETNHPTVMNTFAGQNSGSPVYSALVWSPLKSIYDVNGHYTLPGGGFGPTTNYNPVALAEEPVRDHYANAANIVGNFDYDIIDGLKFSITGAWRNIDNQNNDYFNSRPTNSTGTEVASIVNSKWTYLQNTNMLTYEKAFDQHKLKATGVVEQQYEESSGSTAGAIGFSTDAVLYNNLSLGSNPQVPTSYRTSRSLLSYLLRVNYGFADRYLLTVTGRRDGSSVFGANNKWGYFPSVALGWNISNEQFMKNITSISSLKLRGSYGVTGNQGVQPYQSLATLNTDFFYPIGGSSVAAGVGLGGAANPNLKWERTAQANIGVDLNMFNDRLIFNVDLYRKKTSDLLMSVPLPMTAGGNGTVLRNVGASENKGFEVYVGGSPISKTFKWETGVTFALNKNNVLSLFEGQQDLLLGNPGLPGFNQSVWLEVGEPLGLFRGYDYLGVWKQGEIEEAATYRAQPGDSKYRDVNGDGIIDEQDIVNIGNAQPKFVFGWNNTFSYRNFDLNIFLNGVQGNSIYNISRVNMETGDVTSAKMRDRWTPENEDTQTPSFKGAADGRLNSSRWLEDGSYLRIKNITLGYQLPTEFLKGIKLKHARVYLNAGNLFTFTRYSGFDPEVSIDVDSRAGVDLATYPSQKSFTFGLDLKF
ncbi:SusC/RagA family TonB-linked outer membrane protein [Sphingobacterium deserti]|uniref:TonB-dependent receptor n=1 Tax=Sphingobacterium deserti TaxID=1229276 RepID=A0A0B8T589_9SPHI|nr:TonB-dependent receptor [Sphingobacterium deserti]KGE15623.1 TonB-dependent receptor [Sphingobacterium deserti]